MADVRRRWTTTEDALLWELYQVQEKAPTGKCQKINWNEIARHIPGRSNKDCRKRYFTRFTGGLRKGSWTPEEDERLFQLVERYQYRWATIAQKMETRNADQCSKRWHHCLNPELERSPWSDKENALLLSAVETHGSSWKDIQRCHFPTRSANNIKNQYTILSRKNLQTIKLPPCCSSSTSPPTLPSSRRPPSSTSSMAGNSQHGVSEYSMPPSTSGSTSAYNYASPSLSSTTQISAADYLPATPDVSSAYDFGATGSMGVGLPGESCGYMPQYQTCYYPNVADSNGNGMMMNHPLAMGYDMDLGQFQGGTLHQYYAGQRPYEM
ncbi:uncharacterized protein BDV17DRAFT_196177 [Aspergillus undulatus]|uniref:uncharacterized protein n=1 Tax=Aspergillus undulatus TaxID=1810928 RepID=UPI003CCD7B1E